MTDLTPELKAQGWFNADDEFKPEPNSLYQAMRLFNDGDVVAPPVAMLWDELITDDMNDDSYFFRRLIPITPDTLTKDDLQRIDSVLKNAINLEQEKELTIYQIDLNCARLEPYQTIRDKIRQQLGE